jgi:hypothetical protein
VEVKGEWLARGKRPVGGSIQDVGGGGGGSSRRSNVGVQSQAGAVHDDLHDNDGDYYTKKPHDFCSCLSVQNHC